MAGLNTHPGTQDAVRLESLGSVPRQHALCQSDEFTPKQPSAVLRPASRSSNKYSPMNELRASCPGTNLGVRRPSKCGEVAPKKAKDFETLRMPAACTTSALSPSGARPPCFQLRDSRTAFAPVWIRNEVAPLAENPWGKAASRVRPARFSTLWLISHQRNVKGPTCFEIGTCMTSSLEPWWTSTPLKVTHYRPWTPLNGPKVAGGKILWCGPAMRLITACGARHRNQPRLGPSILYTSTLRVYILAMAWSWREKNTRPHGGLNLSYPSTSRLGPVSMYSLATASCVHLP